MTISFHEKQPLCYIHASTAASTGSKGANSSFFPVNPVELTTCRTTKEKACKIGNGDKEETRWRRRSPK